MSTSSARPAGPLPVVGLIIGAAGLVLAAVALQRGLRGPLPLGGAIIGIAAIVVALIRFLTA